jgi:hypothetical protein
VKAAKDLSIALMVAVLGLPLGAQQKEEQKVRNAGTAMKKGGSVAHRLGKRQ